MKKKLLKLGVLLVISVLAVAILFIASENSNHLANPFFRLYPPHPLVLEKSLDLGLNSYYIAGADSGDIFLGNITAPLKVLSMGYDLQDSSAKTLKMDEPWRWPAAGTRVAFDPPNIFLLNGMMPKALRSDLKSYYATPYLFDSVYFTESVPLSSGSLCIRALSGKAKEYVLGKEMSSPPYFITAKFLLQKQSDGMFSNDGMLIFDKQVASIIYVYYYRNQFICADTNLVLKYRGKTIDTNTTAKVTVARISADNSYVLSAPAQAINRKCAAWGHWLFIHSSLRARNERRQSFDSSCVLDVYSLANGAYAFSARLFDFGGRKMDDFAVCNNKLIAIFDHWLLVYALNPKYFHD